MRDGVRPSKIAHMMPMAVRTRATSPAVLVVVLLVAMSMVLAPSGAKADDGSSPPLGPADPPRETVTFTTPGQHVYTVPDGITRVDVVAVGGEGGHSADRRGGRAARISGTLDVTPGQVLYAVVGSSASGAAPGANGGGAAGGGGCPAPPGAGGGASDVRTVALGQAGGAGSRVLVAGGGGGAGTLGTSGGAADSTYLYGGPRGRGGGNPTLGGFGGVHGVGGVGGAGGSLVPGGFPAGMAGRGEAPRVTFSTPGLPAQAGPLAVSSTATFKQDDQGGGPVSFTNCPASCAWTDGDWSSPAPGSWGGDIGYATTQRWASAAQISPDFLQAFVSGRPGPAGSATDLGKPFLLLNFAHYNILTRGVTPTAIALQTVVTVQPPAGAPVAFRLLGPQAIPVSVLETDNSPPCDPRFQRSTTPCDDVFRLDTEVRATTTANGVTWHFELLGWRTPEGMFENQLSTEESQVTQADLYGMITVDTNPTASTLSVDGSVAGFPMLTLTTAPVPQTGGTVTFTDAGAPIEGCTDLAVGTVDGVTTCTPTGPVVGVRTFGARFNGGVGYAASQAEPVEFAGVMPQTVVFDAPTGLTYGDDDVALGATASSGLAVTYSSSTPAVCATNEGDLQVLAAGTCTITAAQAGDAAFAPAQQSRTFEIDPATLTVTAVSYTHLTLPTTERV